MKSHNMRVPAILSAAAAFLLASVDGGFAASPLKMDFVTHAAFFSAEFKQPKALDPQVFIHDAAAPAATGPQGIKHAARVRPPLIDEDAKSSPLYDAEDKPLGFDLQTWLSASGSVTITEQGGKSLLEADFRGLKPNAHREDQQFCGAAGRQRKGINDATGLPNACERSPARLPQRWSDARARTRPHWN